MCDKETSLKETDFGDYKCNFCGVMISVYNPQKPDWKPEEGGQSSYDEYLENKERKEEMANLGDLRLNLRKDDVQTGDVILFVDAGEIKEVDFSIGKDGSDVKTVFQVSVQLPNGKTKLYIPNATTRGILSDVWGEDTTAWVNKKVTVKFVDQLSFGKLTKVLILEPVIE